MFASSASSPFGPEQEHQFVRSEDQRGNHHRGHGGVDPGIDDGSRAPMGSNARLVHSGVMSVTSALATVAAQPNKTQNAGTPWAAIVAATPTTATTTIAIDRPDLKRPTLRVRRSARGGSLR